MESLEANITSNMRGESKMTNKEIIIDGVDVSGCEFHTTRFFGYVGQNYCKIYDCVCEEPICDNCDYKQRQRLTAQYNAVVKQNKSLQQENVKIKTDNSELFKKAVEARKETDNIFERLQHKEQECEELKEKIKST